ncbi:MAG: right-handed parallel beta-helix repeat-containing protein, partial [Akkermansiaceae bacterium]
MIHPTAVAAVRYVDAQVSGGAGDGSSWANAYTKLQDALAASSSGDNIRVARGVYYPDEGSGQTNNASTSTFTLKDGVNLYGGFENGQSFSQRDPAANLTILSGDLQQDDTNTDGNFIAELSIQKSGTNALHVVTGAGASTSVVFDGFVVTAGSSGGSGSGGGMMLDGSPTTVVDCQFFGNSGANAGAVSTNSAASTFEGCYFHGNVGVFNCGAVSAVGTSATFKDCLFERNSSPAQGGALRVGGGDIYNCRFVKNSVSRTQAAGTGAAIYATGSINMGNCVFYNNISNAGTVYLTGGSGATIANCTFSGNSATTEAGALYFESVNGSRTVTHCIAWNNETAGSQIF